MTNRLKRFTFCAVVAALCLPSVRAAAQSIAVEGDHFVVDRNDGAGPRAKFLVFVSYFDGLRASDLGGDLDYIANTMRFDGIRVLVNWQRRDSDFCADETNSPDRLLDLSGNVQGDPGSTGQAATGPLKKLIDLIAAARARKLVVDVTFTRDTYATGSNPAEIGMNDYIRGVTRVATLLRDYRNVIFDLQNEVAAKTPFSKEDVRRLRDSILANADPAQGDAARIVVVSTGGDYAQVISYNGPRPNGVETSAIAYHDNRAAGWEGRVGDVVAGLRPSGKPTYLQEPQAWNSGLRICGKDEGLGSNQQEADGTAQHFRDAVSNARLAGAAAWTFHTRQGFKLDGSASLRSRILQSSNATEKDMLEGTTAEPSLSTRAATGIWGIDTTLSVDIQGTGDGRVTNGTGAIDCGGQVTKCFATFPPGTSVTLTYSAGSGSEFSGWEGCASTGGSSCSVTLDASKTVVAKFTAVERVSYYDTDAIGSTRLVTDAQGNAVERQDYQPFGEPVTPPGSTPRLFAGKERDPETGNNYFGARYYSSLTGRFTTPDPIVAVERNVIDPQSWNVYAYVKNNPYRYVDPDGRFWGELVNLLKAAGSGVASGVSMTWGLLFSPWFEAVLVDGPEQQPKPTPLLSPETAAGVLPGVAAGVVSGVANAAASGFSVAERSVIRTASEVLRKGGPDLLKAFESGQAKEFVIAGQKIIVQPDAPISGMTLFGEKAFVIGKDAFTSKAEFVKTVLHETYRLNMQQGGAASGASATATTRAAADFAERAYSAFKWF